MISFENNLFTLKTEQYGCILRIGTAGQIECLHFGAPLPASDAAALAPKPGLGWGDSVLYDESSNAKSYEIESLAWSGAGRGDYRESPIALSDDRGPFSTEFRYLSHETVSGTVPFDCTLPQAQSEEAETLIITLEQNGGGLILQLLFTLFPDAMTRRVRLENCGKRVVHAEKLMSCMLDLPGEYEMTTLDGGWIAETHLHRTPVGRARVVNESVTGFSSGAHNPGFLLSEPGADEDHGRVYGFNLVYSGNHYASAQQSLQGLTRVMQGISPDHFSRSLLPGEAFETPEAVLAWSDLGFNGLSRRMHSFVNRCIVPKSWQFRERPVLYNSWEGCMFDFSERRLMALAKEAKALDCELFVLDDGWFAGRNNDTAGLGDYTVDRKKLPGGLSGLSGKLRGMGLDFGLWFEPEAVNPESELYRAHPDWALQDALPPYYGRHELLLDLTRPEVRDYIVIHVSEILDDNGISYVKWDMNRHSPLLGSNAHDYILGLYDVLRRIFEPRPEILFESCSSGGNRFDLGMLCFSPQIWCSDDTDPIERLDIQKGLSYLYPLSAMGAHVSAAPHAQTLRHTPLSTRGNVSFFGVLGYELDLQHLLSVEKAEIRQQIACYKEHRRTFQFGLFRREKAEHDAECWSVRSDEESILGLFHRLVHAAPPYERIFMQGLAAEKQYRAESRPQGLRVGSFGGLLKHITPVALDPNGVILRTADHRYRMKDGAEQFTASGKAFANGISVSARFTGTGYDKSLRVQGDFSSQIYLLKEERDHE